MEQNLPDEQVDNSGSEQSVEENQRREETINYEISTKKVEQTREGYDVERLSIAVLVNRAHLLETLGDGADEETINTAINKHIEEISQLASSAAGLNATRGDQIKVAVVDFQAGTGELEPLPPLTVTQVLLQQSGNVVNAVSILVVSTLLIWFGLRPAISALVPKPVANDNTPEDSELEIGLDDQLGYMTSDPSTHAGLIEELSKKLDASPVRKLERVVEMNEEQSAAILKQWFYESETA